LFLQNNNAVQAVVNNNILPDVNNNALEDVNNTVLILLLDNRIKTQTIEETQKFNINDQYKCWQKKNLTEINRLHNSYHIMEKLNWKCGNSSTDMEYRIDRLWSLKPKNKNEEIKF